MPSEWYEGTRDADLRQGELIWTCPRLIHASAALEGEVTTAVEEVHAVLITQSCDLNLRDGRPKVEHLLMCPFHTKAELATHPKFRSGAAWEEVRKGRVPRFHILDRCDIAPIADEFLLVDLGAAFSLAYAVVIGAAQIQTLRPRLRSPYLEHLAQAFARYYMRVGLPSDIPHFA